MQQGDGVDEALHGAARDVEPNIGGGAGQQLVEIVAVEPGRERDVRGALEVAQALLEAETVPDSSPERDAALAITKEVGARLEQAGDGRAQLLGADAVGGRDRPRGRSRQIGARLHEVESAVAPDE